jgi:hypothetical protein
MINVAALTEIANRTSYERRRAEFQGFRFGRMEVTDEGLFDNVHVKGTFQCVCGRTEAFRFIIHVNERMPLDHLAVQLDIGRRLREHGSFDQRHLKEDGYTDEQIGDILAKGLAFDIKEGHVDPYIAVTDFWRKTHA